ncbi:conserved hypothetical protein [Candidatus Desulfarcum epimagneticum]|uniref:Lipoprotein n=1 Tax=uncultured Desulfobacteraceae bacterium TaxID=218296 RepID=A0A484HKS1_9BACT|nr:conserved hypothetical protein [uncultured Desulfobacteraceae bacterium]
MRFLRIFWILIVGLFLFSGCFQKYEIDGFKSAENKFHWGSVGGKLKGKMEMRNNTAVRRSPYELLIWFSSETPIEGIVQILGLKLTYAKSKKNIFNKDNIPEKRIKKYTRIIKKPAEKHINDYTAYFSFKNINMEYSDVILQINFILKQGEKSTKYNAEIYFEKDYKKFKIIKGV